MADSAQCTSYEVLQRQSGTQFISWYNNQAVEHLEAWAIVCIGFPDLVSDFAAA